MEKKNQINPYPIRMPDWVRAALEVSAKQKGRSLHTEIIKRLEASVSSDRGEQQEDDFVQNAITAAQALIKISKELERDPRLKAIAESNQPKFSEPQIPAEYRDALEEIRKRISKNKDSD